MPFFIPALISGISALAGGLGNRKSVQQQQSTSTQNVDSSTMPIYDSKTGIVRDRLLNEYLSRLESTPDFIQNYLTKGTQNINRASDIASRVAENVVRARGLGRTTAGTVPVIGRDVQRAYSIADLENTAPLMERQFDQENLLNLSNFFSKLPTGSRTMGTTTTNTQGSVTNPGNVLGGAVGGLGAALGGLYSSGGLPGTAPYRQQQSLTEMLARIYGMGGGAKPTPTFPNGQYEGGF